MPIQILWGNDLNAQNTFIEKFIDKEVSKEWREINVTYLIDILENAKDLPSLIIGMPVGFIGVEKSKNKLISTDLPRIVLNSTRGGAAMAAAAVNALLRETI